MTAVTNIPRAGSFSSKPGEIGGASIQASKAFASAAKRYIYYDRMLLNSETIAIMRQPRKNMKQKNKSSRYFQFSLLILCSGSLYPLLYLRQNFESTILQAYSLNLVQLGELYSLLGFVFLITYLPSGWLADRVNPGRLIPLSLVATAALGFWFSTRPPLTSLRFLFIGWGVFSGLTFWSALIKAVKLLAEESEQGRFFGLLEGLRGLVEAMLATVAVSVFAYLVTEVSKTEANALVYVIYIYSCTCLFLGILSFFSLRLTPSSSSKELKDGNLWQDLKTLMSIPEVWLISWSF